MVAHDDDESATNERTRLELVGRLAGGIAHDCNNLLTVILHSCTAIDRALAADHPARPFLAEIRLATERTAGLAGQLIASTGRAARAPHIVDLNQVVRAFAGLVRRLLGASVDVDLVLDASGAVLADPSQLEQVLLNLVTNARDAMPRGGRVTIATRDVELGPGEATLPPGRYLLLSVADTGMGMDVATAARAFEPRFTTKGGGGGSGLGLATCQGIVHRQGGAISVTSVPGQGSTFEVLLPRADE